MDEKVSVIIPVYNEEKRIEKTIKGLINIKEIGEIIIVDDGSKDNTKEVVYKIKNKKILYYRFKKNLGKGAALRKGVEISKYPIIAFLDGDLGNTSKEIIKLIKPILQNKADVTIACFPKPSIKGGFGIVKKVSKIGVKFLTGKEIKNPICGQRVMKKDILLNIEIPNRFAVEVGMIIDILNQNFKIKEIPVMMKHRETKRDLKGFLHRGKELKDIIYILIKKYYKLKKYKTILDNGEV
ncbi:glycosyltransferase family 2 protein [Defluviitalea phaphyphila]|uniref:glycosyltransferase family 2 protein n=1 Tax=Defluviitalea phaphyphila TaxID=1473580 RepID=UPI00072FC54D|nr:glycosyltransferase family 2 protein [Defluviitalea phaphyphila]